ncbi:MAG: proton-conducting membrane transporter [Acidobacteria bacterium]|nr:proton-conducting membrane transporter [Acidobacteriota bacterium]
MDLAQLTTPQLLLLLTVALPGAAFLGLAIAWLLGWTGSERVISRVTGLTYVATTLSAFTLFARMLGQSEPSVTVPLGPWFEVPTYSFPLTLFVDPLSMPLVLATSVLIGLVGTFAQRYLHREKGFLRFFLLLHLFGFGSVLVFSAGSYDLIICGWELVGITSVMLIAFFQDRRRPVENAIRVFAIYRSADAGLLIGVFLLHHAAGSAMFSELFQGPWPGQALTGLDGASATAIGLLFLFAGAGKAAQVPFSGWLPRAMEGPTPSSAIFYGAISVHAGAYLLLRSEPILRASSVAAWAVIAIGAVTAIVGGLSGRAAADVKTALAQASLAQLGLIFVEIGLGLTWLALLHISGHMVIRTLQFLRAPSVLRDYHRIHAVAEGRIASDELYYEAMLPAGLRAWLYRLASDRGHLDTILDRFFIGPLLALARLLADLERRRVSPFETPRPSARLAPVLGDPNGRAEGGHHG